MGTDHPPHSPINGKAMTVVEHDGPMMARWSEAGSALKTNLNQSGAAGRALVTRALASADLRTRAVVGQVIDVVGYVAHVAELTDQETGEVYNKVRVVMVLADGRTVSTMSAACVRTLRYLSQVTENKPWNPPLRLIVKEHPLGEGKSYCDLVEVAQDEPGASKTKRG